MPLLVAFAVLGALAFPSTDWSLLAWVWLTPVLACAMNRTPRQALGDGWLTGTVFFLVLLRWLDHTLRSYSQIPWPLTWLPILALAAYCGLYVAGVIAAVAWLRAGLGHGMGTGGRARSSGLPGVVRGRLMGGFPWGLLGYSQHTQLAHHPDRGADRRVRRLLSRGRHNAAIVGCSTWAGALLPAAGAAVMLLSGSVSFGLIALEPETSRPASATHVRVAVIQPSIEQSVKWDAAPPSRTRFAVLERLTRHAAGSRPAVILWPNRRARPPAAETRPSWHVSPHSPGSSRLRCSSDPSIRRPPLLRSS